MALKIICVIWVTCPVIENNGENDGALAVFGESFQKNSLFYRKRHNYMIKKNPHPTYLPLFKW